MVLYQLESLHLDDYNLIYSQNKNRGFLQNFDSISFENSTFSLFINTTQNQSKPILTNNTKQLQHNPKNSFTTKTKLFLSTFGVFPNSKTRTKGLGLFLTSNLFEPYALAPFFLFDHLETKNGNDLPPKSGYSSTLALLFSLPLSKT